MHACFQLISFMSKMSLASIICLILARFESELIIRTHVCFQLVSSMTKMPLAFIIEVI
jgi:hypothetical protein